MGKRKNKGGGYCIAAPRRNPYASRAQASLRPVHEQQHRHADQRGNHEKGGIADSGDDAAGVAAKRFRQERHQRTENGVLHGGKADAGQRRQEGDEDRAGKPRREIIEADHTVEQPVMAAESGGNTRLHGMDYPFQRWQYGQTLHGGKQRLIAVPSQQNEKQIGADGE